MSDDTYTVSEISQVIRDQLALTFPSELWIRGEIQNLNRHGSGNVYFQLASADAGDDVLSVTLFTKAKQQVNRRLKGVGVRMSDGTEVRILARLEWFAKQGRPQLRMADIDPEFTLGRLELDRERLLAALRSDGLLDANARLPVPPAPVRIGLVTSEGSAAHRDFIAELESSGHHWEVLLVSTAVQGPGAEHEVATAIRSAELAGVELVAVVRGGGARTDLATFDKEVLARTVAGCGVPVFVGVGHEIDHTLIEEVAARSFKTPTACAAALCSLVGEHLAAAEDLWSRIVARAEQHIDRADQQLKTRGASVDRRTSGAIGRSQSALALAAERLRHGAERAAERSDRRLATTVDQLRRRTTMALERAEQRQDTARRVVAANDPVRAMRRGWSFTVGPDGAVVRDPASLRPGDTVRTRVQLGQITSTITVVESLRSSPHDPSQNEES